MVPLRLAGAPANRFRVNDVALIRLGVSPPREAVFALLRLCVSPPDAAFAFLRLCVRPPDAAFAFLRLCVRPPEAVFALLASLRASARGCLCASCVFACVTPEAAFAFLRLCVRPPELSLRFCVFA